MKGADEGPLPFVVICYCIYRNRQIDLTVPVTSATFRWQIFPRFYFVSNVALLDMLANGTNPPKIMPYLGDCYDSLANLTFVPLEDGTTSSKTINEMVRSCQTRLASQLVLK